MRANSGLTASIVFEGMSLNYGEGFGNVSELKKLTRGNKVYTYISRQALRHELFQFILENMPCNLTPVVKGNASADSGNGNDEDNTDEINEETKQTKNKNTVQFAPEASIRDYPEIDLFGYMKTGGKKEDKKKGSKKKTSEKGEAPTNRAAVVKITPAVSLEEYGNDIEFANNLDLARRCGAYPNLYQLEQHKSLYTYTISVDLDKVGYDQQRVNGREEIIEIPVEEKVKRVEALLDAVKFLKRSIKGRWENLSPLFVIGGLYPIKNPFFLNRIKLTVCDGGYGIEPGLIKSVCELTLPNSKKVGEYTLIGIANGYFVNEREVLEILPVEAAGSIDYFFETLKQRVREYYEERVS